MPIQEIPLPVGAKGLVPALPTIDRSGEDGNVPVALVFSGDNFIGEALEGHWKVDDSSMGQIYDTSSIQKIAGQLEFKLRSDVANNYSRMWVQSIAGFPIIQDAYIDVHLESHTGSPSYNNSLYFFLRSESVASAVVTSTDSPLNDPNYLAVQIRRTTTPTYEIRVLKNVEGSQTVIYAYTAITNEEGTFRIKFRLTDGKIDVYFHDGAGAVVESSDELTLTDDDWDLYFDAGHPALMVETQEATFRTMISDGITVSIPDFSVGYDQDAADYGKGDVQVFDTMGSATESDWRRVYNEQHDFTGDCVIQNSLIRMVIDEGASTGVEFHWWNGSAWAEEFNEFAFEFASTFLANPYLLSIDTLNRDEVLLKFRFSPSAVKYPAVYGDVWMLVKRGKYYATFTIDKMVPEGEFGVNFYNVSPRRRWDYCGDDQVGDDDLAISASNTTMTDNFLIVFDDAGNDVLGFIAINQKPNGSVKAFRSNEGDQIKIDFIDSTDFAQTEIHVGQVPFQDVDKLFLEAESGTYTGSSASDGTASGGTKIELDSQTEYVYYQFLGGTDLPEGRYMLIVRAKDSNQVSNDFELSVYNETDSEHCNEFSDSVKFTLTASWAYYSIVFQLEDNDLSGDTIRCYVVKDTATANTIDVDHFLLIPLGNGIEWPQDIAHNAMREATVNFRLTDTATFQLFSGLGLTGQLAGSVYTDAMAVAAIESALSIDLSGSFSAGTIKTGADGGGFYAGAADDFRAYHDGSDTYVQSNTGTFFIKSIGNPMEISGSTIRVDITANFEVRDTEDSNAVLMELDSDLRTFKLGSNTDPIIEAGTADYDKFLVLDDGQVKFRTGGELAADIGASVFSGTQWTLPVFFTATSLADSILKQNAAGQYLYMDHTNTSMGFRMISAVDGGNPFFWVGSAYAGDGVFIQANYDGGAQTLNNVFIGSTSSSGTDGAGVIRIWADGTMVAEFYPTSYTGGPTLIVGYDMKVGSKLDTGTVLTIDAKSPLTGPIIGVDIDLTGISYGGNNVTGLKVALGTYGAGTEYAVQITGDGRTVLICTDDYAVDVTGEVRLNTINAEATDVDKFLVDSSGVIKYRTGAQVAADIGAASVPLALTDLASYAQGSIIIGGGTDWEPLPAGTEDYVLKMGAAEPAWGQVDWSELVGTQPAPVNHNLVDTTGHPVAGLTPGHYLKALTATTYGFAELIAIWPQPEVAKDAVIWRPDLTTWSDGERPDFVVTTPGDYELDSGTINFCKTDTSIYYASGYDAASFKFWHDDAGAGPSYRIMLPWVSAPSWEIRWRWRRDSGDELLRGHSYIMYGWFWDNTDLRIKYLAMFSIETIVSGTYNVRWESPWDVKDSIVYSTDTWYDWRFQFVAQKGPSGENSGQGRSSLVASSGASWQTSWSGWFAFGGTDGTDTRYSFLSPAFIQVGYNNVNYETLQWFDDLEILVCDHAMGY